MAEVLPPPMQSSSTITMLHSRPSSADAFQTSSQQYSPSPRLGQTPRSMYNGQNASYRGTTAPPVQPYAFQSTPHLRQDTRTSSAPVAPTTSHAATSSQRPGHAASASTSSSEGSSAHDNHGMSSRQGSVINLTSQPLDLSFTSFEQSAKSSPDRYRRPGQKRTESSNATPKVASPQLGSGPPSPSAMASAGHTYQHLQSLPVQRPASVDDMALPRASSVEIAKRYRRRSMNTLETQNLSVPGQVTSVMQRAVPGQGASATSTPTTIRPVSLQSQTGGDDAEVVVPRNSPNAPLDKVEAGKEMIRQPENAKSGVLPPAQKSVMVPPRGSSDVNKRLAAPSPLSKQADEAETPASAAPPKPRTYAAVAQAAVNAAPSPAAQQLAALSDKDLNKGMKSRLRRAFSFGSAHELRRAAGENSQAAAAQHAKVQHQQRVDDELDAEQQEIARRQEAAGIGASIYSGQGGFTGSTDNLSISSTASSASMMLRKMSRGAKKGARSIKGLFRPKSVIGVPAADGPVQVQASAPAVQPSAAQVSAVTVEAERVNVNADATDLPGGGTGYPKLERNSIDAANGTAASSESRGSNDGSESISRRSIVGSDKDRAEVLAAVKKGILKRSANGSPAGSPVIRASDAVLAPASHFVESPVSSMPSTPKDGSQRSTSMNGDYFTTRVASLTKSMPNTPGGSARSISFNDRIQFHDAWSSTEYDRRGEIATCNRLTPMLAQQIKEELNTFKMEMEVHELSKPHTHFF